MVRAWLSQFRKIQEKMDYFKSENFTLRQGKFAFLKEVWKSEISS